MKMSAKESFLENLDQAEKILDVVKIRQQIQPLKRLKLRPEAITPIRDFIVKRRSPSSVVTQTTKLVDDTVKTAIPLLLVYSVACLENFLKTIGKNGKLYHMIEAYKKETDPNLIQKVHEIRKRRNVFVHNLRYEIKAEMKEAITKAKNDLDILRKFAYTIS